MLQRKKQPDQTRQAILNAADHEFSTKGYTSAGLGGIVALSGLTKGALFHHFPDKRALAKAWICERLAPAIQELWVSPIAAATSLDQMRQICDLRYQESSPGDATSALVAMASEVGVHDEILAGEIEGVFEAWREALVDFFLRGKESGWLYPGIRAEQEAMMVMSLFAGFSVTGKLPQRLEIRRHAIAGLGGYLETLRPQ